MKCPNDDTTLIMSERQNIEIDYCPTCRGVWLDRGELDKIIERSTAAPEVTPIQPSQSYQAQRQEYRESSRDSYHPNSQSHYKKKKKESFLGDLFDF